MLVAACSSSSSGEASPGTGSDTDAGITENQDPTETEADAQAGRDTSTDAQAPVTPLACNSHTWCTTYSVKVFQGAAPAPQGGVISDGAYRLAYTLDPRTDANQRGTTDSGDLLYFENGQFASPGSSGFGAVGTYSTAAAGAEGPTLSLKGITNCGSFGKEGSPAGQTRSFPYTATATELIVLHTLTPLGQNAPPPFQKAYVYRKVTGNLCAPGTKDLTTPGDTFACRVANCSCAESSGKDLTAAQCPFIH